MALKGDTRTLRSLQRALKNLPITASARIAARSAPAMSALARGAFDSGESVYGPARQRGVDGRRLTLEKTGRTRGSLEFAATGRDIRLVRLPNYARYLISPYGLLPNGPLPISWREQMTRIAAEVLHSEIFGGRQ